MSAVGRDQIVNARGFGAARFNVVVVVALALGGVGACDAPASPPQWSEARPIVTSRCSQCHQDGGVAPFPIVTLDDVRAFNAAIRDSVVDGSMPPWKADPTCNAYANDRRLGDDEKATLLAFLDAGAPADDGDTAAIDIPALPRLSRTDLALTPSSTYAPTEDDNYRCFAIEWPLATPAYITGFDFLPLEGGLVHHANLYVNEPADRQIFLGREARDDVVGYDCGLGSAANGAQLLGSYAPGASAIEYPDDSGILVEPGSVLVFEVHYGHGGDGSVDQPTLELTLEDFVARRALGAGFWNFLIWDDGQMAIPAGSANVTHSVTLEPSGYLASFAPWFTATNTKIHVGGLHMHRLGKSGFIGVDSNGERTCLLAINDWDPNWQEGYTLKEPIPFVFGRDELVLECIFDNSAENQPFVDGHPRAPETRNWGPRTDDEMCMGFLYIVPDE